MESDFLGKIYCDLANVVDLIQSTDEEDVNSQLSVIELALQQIQSKIENRANRINKQ